MVRPPDKTVGYGPCKMAGGKWQEEFTYFFLHISLPHLPDNVVSVDFQCSLMRQEAKVGRYLQVYAVLFTRFEMES